MIPRLRWASGLALVVVVGACAKRPASTPAAAAPEAAPMSEAAGADGLAQQAELDTWEQELAHLRGELRAAGVPLADGETSVREEATQELEREHGVAADAGDDSGRCQRICDLAEAICDLQDKICALADDDPNERRASACSGADDDCRRASEACRACSA